MNQRNGFTILVAMVEIDNLIRLIKFSFRISNHINMMDSIFGRYHSIEITNEWVQYSIF